MYTYNIGQRISTRSLLLFTPVVNRWSTFMSFFLGTVFGSYLGYAWTTFSNDDWKFYN